MRICIGVALDGLPVRIDTSVDEVVVLVGDPGAGKTTHARFLLRWWTAAQRPATVLTSHPGEYADYQARSKSVVTAPQPLWTRLRPIRNPPRNGLATPDLLIVDDGDRLAETSLRDLVMCRRGRSCLTLVISHGPAAQSLAELADRTIGLLTDDCSNHDAGQGRLDWPACSVITRPRRRGHQDLPPHRWQAVAAAENPHLRCAR